MRGGEEPFELARMGESAAEKRQRLRRLKKQLATIESLLQEDSDAAQAAVARTTAASARAAPGGGGSAKRLGKNSRVPPPPQSPNTAAATTRAFGARGGPANAKLRERLKREGDVAGSNGVTGASFAAALQGNYRPQGPVSCEDTHRLLKEREAEQHEMMMRNAKVAAAITVDRIDTRMRALELKEARERAAGAAEARRTGGAAAEATEAAEAAALEADRPASGSAISGLPKPSTRSTRHAMPTHATSEVVDPDPPQLEASSGEQRGTGFEEVRQETGEEGQRALRSLAKELWRSFNKELARAGPPRMPPRLRLPPPGWTAKDLENLEIRILEAGGVPVRRLAAFSFQSSAAICGSQRGPAGAQKEVCAICLGNLDRPAGEANSLRLEARGPSWLRELPCGHCFHPSCVCDWLLCEHKCPMCRQNLLECD
eukprot:COSAG02_NODE_1459_length_12495_cov_15.203937_7_plen_430_part_00